MDCFFLTRLGIVGCIRQGPSKKRNFILDGANEEIVEVREQTRDGAAPRE